MTDERDEDLMHAGEYDDDRLLALALGLEEDPELLAAAEADAELGARLEAMRAHVAAVGAQVSAAVPEPEESYTDLSGERWGGLKEFFEPPAGTAKPRRERRWWRVVAPVAALAVLALFVGLIAVNGGGSGSGSSSSGVVAQSSGDGVPLQNSGASGKGTQAPEVTEPATLGERFAEELDRFAVVVLARARQVSGAVQRFAVLRIFKGSAPKVVELVVSDQPADVGRLHLLMLEPTAAPEAQDETPWPPAQPTATGSPLPDTVSPAPATPSPTPETASPGPTPSLAAGEFGRELAVSYTYDGAPTVVREFPAGTDPRSVKISVP